MPAASTSANRTGRWKTNTSDAGRRERDFLHQADLLIVQQVEQFAIEAAAVVEQRLEAQPLP